MQEDISVGEHVKVEADRGEDLGVVTNIITANEFYELRRQHNYMYGNNSTKDDEATWEVKLIIRIASTYEKKQLPIKAMEELQVVQNCCQLVNFVYMLPMTIVDAEFQFDRHKLVIFYESNK